MQVQRRAYSDAIVSGMQVLTTALVSPRSPQVQRRAYSDAIVSGTVPLPPRVQADVKLCGAHCSLSDGVPPEAW
jgi:hypothetical protein